MNTSRTRKTQESGFIALVSALVISAILITLAYSASTSSFYARFDALGAENKRISLGLAESCVNVALLNLATSVAPTTYTPTNLEVHVGVDEYGDDMTCMIQSITHSGSVATIDTQASWKGSFSNITARATIPDPSVGSLVPPPTCAITASPSIVPSGQTVLLQWATANASSFSLDHALGPQAGVANGSYSFTASGVGAVTYIGTASGPGGSVQCSASFTVTAPPPAPACADTVMMLDRTGSLSSADRANVKSAANTLVDLYAGVSTQPKVGAGSFGSWDNQHFAAVPSPQGWLQSTYPSLKTTISNMVDNTANCTDVPSGQSCGTNVAAAVTAGYQELGSVRHTAGFQKVLIFVSDGQANRPSTDPLGAALTAADAAKNNGVSVFTVLYNSSGSQTQTDRTFMAQLATGNIAVPGHLPGSDDNSIVATNSGFLYPTSIHTPNTWTNPANAFGNDSTYATDSVTNHQQGYSSFHFNVPSGATISGIEANVSGLSGAATVNTSTITPSNIGASNAWSLAGAADKQSAVATSNGDSSYISSASANAQTYIFPGAAIPLGSTINSVSVSAVARSTTGAPSISIRAEDAVTPANVNDGSSFALTASYATSTRVMTQNPLTGLAWTLSEINTAAVRYGVVKGGTGNARVTNLYMVINYSPPASGSCQIATNISWNNGSSWNTTAKSITLTGTETTYAVGGPSDTWGRTWSSNELSDSNFVLRLTNTNCSGTLAASVNSVQVRVYYTGSNPETENTDGDHFFITPSTSLSSIQNIFDTIGKLICPAAAAKCANGVDDDGDGVADAADPMCHLGGSLANPYDGTINDEYEHPAPPGPPTAPPPPPSVDLGAWEEVPH